MSGPAVVAVVVSYETREWTLRCVESLLADRDVPGRLAVVVVDNASRDGTAAAVAERFGDDVTLIAETRNTGFAAACNRGAAVHPDAAFVLVLNGDTTVAPGAVARLVQELDAHPEAAIAAPLLTDVEGHWQPSVRGHPGRLALLHQHTALRFLRVGAAAYEDYKRPPALGEGRPEVPVVMGAAMLVRGDDYRAAAGLDERYFLYFEEADLCRRMAQRGRAVRYVRDASVRHEGGASSDGHRERALVWYLRSLFLYVDRFDGRGAGLVYRAVFKPLFLVRMVTDALRDALTVVFRPSRRAEKCKELGLAGRFLVRGVWTFLAS